MRNESQWMRLQVPDHELTNGVARGRPIAVIVLEDGTELHFFQLFDSDQSLEIDDSRYRQSVAASNNHALHASPPLHNVLVLFCSVLQPSSIRGLATPWTYFLHLSMSPVILTDSSTESPVHVLMLSIQAVRGLHRLRAPGIVPCIISFSRRLPCFLMV